MSFKSRVGLWRIWDWSLQFIWIWSLVFETSKFPIFQLTLIVPMQRIYMSFRSWRHWSSWLEFEILVFVWILSLLVHVWKHSCLIWFWICTEHPYWLKKNYLMKISRAKKTTTMIGITKKYLKIDIYMTVQDTYVFLKILLKS